MSLNLKEMEYKIDEQLAKETRLSLTIWFASNCWHTYKIKGILRIIKLYSSLLIPLSIYKRLTNYEKNKFVNS